MADRRRQLNLRLSEAHLAHLDRMAKEAGVHPGSLAKSMLESLIDDDVKAHAIVEKK